MNTFTATFSCPPSKDNGWAETPVLMLEKLGADSYQMEVLPEKVSQADLSYALAEVQEFLRDK